MNDCVVIQPIAQPGLDLMRRAGLVVCQPRSTAFDDLRPVLRTARAVITRNEGFSARAIAASPVLKIIVSHGTGTDRIDHGAANARGILVLNTPGYNTRSVAEHALALMLACARRIPAADRAVRARNWAFRETDHPVELAGRTLGLVGFGRIAQALAPLALGIGMKVAVCSGHLHEEELQARGLDPRPDLEALLSGSDVVSLHGMPGQGPVLDARRLALMGADAIVINTARGVLIDEPALAEALRAGRIRAAALDVFGHEPPSPDSPLFDCPNLILTPHMGGSAVEALDRTSLAVARKVIQGLGLALPD